MEKKRALIGVAIVVLATLVLLGAWGIRYRHQQKEKPIPIFSKILSADNGQTFVDLLGAPKTLSLYQGAPVVLMAWASWCPSCGDQLALLSKVAKEEAVHIPLVAINRGETLEIANEYLAFIQKPDSIEYLVDTKDLFFRTVEGYAMPEFMFLDAEGKEVFHQRGTLVEEEIRTAIGRLREE